MDEEKMQKQMEFLLEWQAQFAAELGELKENVTRLGENVTRLGENVMRLEGVVERVVGVVEGVVVNVERVVVNVERVVVNVERWTQVTAERLEAVDKRGDETDRKIVALVDAQIQTEVSLRNLSATVDRHIAEGHNGRARPEG